MMHSHTNCICLTFSTVRFKCFFKSPCREYAWPLVYNLFGFQLHPQIACLNRCKFALTAFVYSSPLCVLKLLWYFRRSMLPLQLWIHLSKSLEISHEEDRDKKESDLFIFCFVRVWRCRTLTWVFISIRNWSCNHIFTRFPPHNRSSHLLLPLLPPSWPRRALSTPPKHAAHPPTSPRQSLLSL